MLVQWYIGPDVAAAAAAAAAGHTSAHYNADLAAQLPHSALIETNLSWMRMCFRMASLFASS